MSSDGVTGGILPVLTDMATVLFPGMRWSLPLRENHHCSTIRSAVASHDGVLAVFTARAKKTASNRYNLYEVGTLARVTNLVRCSCCGEATAQIVGLRRVRAISFADKDDFHLVGFTPIADHSEDPETIGALVSAVRDAATTMNRLFPRCRYTTRANEYGRMVNAPEDLLGAIIDLLFYLPVAERQRLLEMDPLSARLEWALHEFQKQLDRCITSPPKRVQLTLLH